MTTLALTVALAIASAAWFYRRTRIEQRGRVASAAMAAFGFVTLVVAYLLTVGELSGLLAQRGSSPTTLGGSLTLRWIPLIALGAMTFLLGYLAAKAIGRAPAPAPSESSAPSTDGPPRPRRMRYAVASLGVVAAMLDVPVLGIASDWSGLSAAEEERARLAQFVAQLEPPFSAMRAEVVEVETQENTADPGVVTITHEVQLVGRVGSLKEFDRLHSVLAEEFGDAQAGRYLRFVLFASGLHRERQLRELEERSAGSDPSGG